MKVHRIVQMIVLVTAAAGLYALSAGEKADSREAVLDVQGMTCQSCANRIRSVLKNVDGVETAEVSFDAAEARITYDPARVGVEEFVAAINTEGFSSAERSASGATSGEAVEPARTKVATASSCSATTPTATTPTATTDGSQKISEEGFTRVVDYITSSILANVDDPRVQYTKEEIEEATGVRVSELNTSRLQTAVIARLRDERPEVLASLTGGTSRCAEYDACSLHGDLSGATGETLEMYVREKAEDGVEFDDRPMPSFQAFDLEGNQVTTDSLAGRPAVLAFLAGHCTHSMDSFPVLQELAQEYGPEGLQVVAVVVNSGTPEDVASWVSEFKPVYDVWVHEDDSLGDVVGSHLVPTYLFVNADGRIREKLVGFKQPQKVNGWVSGMLTPAPSIAGR